jgi:hypothetical protein
MSGRAEPELFVLAGSCLQPASSAQLKDIFKRQSTKVARRLRAASERIAELEDKRETRNAMRRLRREMRGWDRIGGRQIRICMPKPPVAPRRRTPKVQISRASNKPIPLPSNRGPIIDRKGRKGIFLDLEYDGAQKERKGVARRRIEYQFLLDHAETMLGMPLFCSNMGDDENEVLACADMLEMVNRAARKNAKVGINAILQCPSELDLAGRVAFLNRVARHFESLGIAYCMTLHRPDPDGDQRNHHLHIWFTLRSIEQVGVRDWSVGEQLRTDLDGSEAMYTLRRECADIATETCYAQGHNVRYTHLSNPARGLSHTAQQKLGKRRTEKVRRGEFDAINEANRQLIKDNEVLADEIAERKALAVRPIIIPALSTISVPSIVAPPVIKLTAPLMIKLEPVIDHVNSAARIEGPFAPQIDGHAIVEVGHKVVHSDLEYARAVKLPINIQHPKQAGKGLSLKAQMPPKNSPPAKIHITVSQINVRDHQLQFIQIVERLNVGNMLSPKMFEPHRTPNIASQPTIELREKPILRHRGIEPVNFPNAFVKSTPTTIKYATSVPVVAPFIKVPVAVKVSLPMLFEPFVLKQQASTFSDTEVRQNDLVAELAGLLAGLDNGALASKPIVETAPVRSAQSKDGVFADMLRREALRQTPANQRASGANLPLDPWAMMMREISERDRSKISRGSPDSEHISDMSKNVPGDARGPLQAPANAPLAPMPAPLVKPSMAHTGDGIPALPPTAQTVTPEKVIATGPSNVGPSNNEFKDAVMEALRSPERLTGDTLQTAIANMDAWHKTDKHVLVGLIKSQFDRLASNQTVMQWRLLRRKQRSAEEEKQYRKLTAQLNTDEALIAWIRSQAPLVELLLRRAAQQISLKDNEGQQSLKVSETGSTTAQTEPAPKADDLMKPYDDALKSKSPSIKAWVRAHFRGDSAQRLSAAQRIRNDDQAESEAAALHPLIYNAILDDAPNRHVKTQHVGPLRGQIIQIDRGLGIEPD